MDLFLVFAFGFVVWITLSSALNPYRPRPRRPKDDWLDKIEFVSPYNGGAKIELSKVGSSRRMIIQKECEDEV